MQLQPGKAARSRTATLLFGGFALALVILILAYPDDAFQASLGGLRLWWTVLVPGLLPYLVVIELFAGFGLVRAFGALVEPPLRALFRIPPGGGTAVVAGFLGGFPQGALAAGRLCAGRKPPRQETDQLFFLSHLCSPALLVTVVGAGFLQNVRAGVLLAFVHYLSAGAAAWLGRLTPASRPAASGSPKASGSREEPAEPFFTALQTARKEDGRTFGQLLGDAVTASLQTLFTLSGFIILFSVLTRMISLQLPDEGIRSWFLLIPAILEPHLGAYAAASRLEPSALQLAVMGAALAWGGISQHLQLKAVAGDAPPGYARFLAGRLLHALLAFGLTLAAAAPLAEWLFSAQGASLGSLPLPASPAAAEPVTALQALFSGGWTFLMRSLKLSLAAAGLLLGAAALCGRLGKRVPRH